VALRKGLRVVTPSLWLGAGRLEREMAQERRLEDIDEKTENIEAKVELAAQPRPTAPPPPSPARPVAQVTTLPRAQKPEVSFLKRPEFPRFEFVNSKIRDPIVYGTGDVSIEKWCSERFALFRANADNIVKKEKYSAELEAYEVAKKLEEGLEATPEKAESPQGASGFWTSDSSYQFSPLKPRSLDSSSEPSSPSTESGTTGSSAEASRIISGSSGSSGSPQELSSTGVSVEFVDE
jgi:hypothetical protein